MELEEENNILRRLLQDVLDYGKLAHFQKKKLWRMGFKVDFPRRYKWMEKTR